MATTVTSRVYYTGRSGANWDVAGTPAAGKSYLDDQSDATYLRHTNAIPSMSNSVSGTVPAHSAPANHGLHRARACARTRTHSGSTSINTFLGIYWAGVASYVQSPGPSALTTAWTQYNWPWATLPAGVTTAAELSLMAYTVKFDIAELWVEYDYRLRPAFTLAATSGGTRYATLTATGLSLDGLPAKSWELSIAGPIAWSRNGSGAFPALGVVTPELADGTYTATLTIAAGIRNNETWSTTKTIGFTIASDDQFTLLADYAHEASLADHFDLACHSIGATWCCDRAGILQFAQEPPTTPAWTFTDEPGPGIPYSDITIGYDSRNLVNDLEATNYTTDTETTYRHRDPVSTALWGSRTAALAMTVYDVGGALARRVAALVDKFSTLGVVPTQVTFHANRAPEAAAGIDLWQKAHIRYRGTTYPVLITGITHTLTPTGWKTTTDLIKE